MNRKIKAVGWMFILTYVTVFNIAFLLAFLSPSKSIILHINLFNEAYLELFLVMASLPIICSLLLGEFKKLYREARRETISLSKGRI